MFMEFLSLNYMTVLIVIALMIVYFVYREYKIPSSGLVPIISLIILINATNITLKELAFIWSKLIFMQNIPMTEVKHHLPPTDM